MITAPGTQHSRSPKGNHQETRTRRASSSGRFAKLLLLTVTAILCLPLCELTVRLLAPQPPSWLGVHRHHPTLPFFTLDINVNRLVDTGETRYSIHTNEEGFRVAAAAEPVSDTPIAIVLGDSYTFGHGVEYEESFVGLLNDHLSTSNRFINAGVSNYGPVQYRKVLEYLLDQDMQPELIVICTYTGNDFYDCLRNKDLPVVDGIIGNKGGMKSFIRRHSHLSRLAGKARFRLSPRNIENAHLGSEMYQSSGWQSPPLRQCHDLFVQEFKEIASLCHARGIPLLGVLIPTRDAVDSARRLSSAQIDEELDYTLPIRKADDVLVGEGIQSIDLTSALVEHSTGETYYWFDQHLTAFGHKVAAEAIAAEIRSLMLDSNRRATDRVVQR